MRSVKDIVYLSINVMAGIILFSFLKDSLSCKENKLQEPQANIESLTTDPTEGTENLAPDIKSQHELPNTSLSRYQKLKGKVLLSSEESIEREHLLSQRQFLDWITATLTNPLLTTALKDRLSMIDFLEDAITWEDNPIREEVVSLINQIILSETYLRADGNAEMQLIGDKIELFTILSQEFPERSADILEKVSGTRIELILKYAAKRLPLTKSKSLEGP